MDAGGVSLDELLGSFASEPEPDSEAAPAAALGPYRCLRRTLVRDGYEAFSSVLGALEAGEVVDIVEEQILENGASRLRLERTAGASGPVGWVSATGPTGQAFLLPAGDVDAAEATVPASLSATVLPPASSDGSAESTAPNTAEQKKKSWFGWGTSADAHAVDDGDVVADAAATQAMANRAVVPVERVRMVSVVTRTDDKGKQYTAFGITVYPLPVAAGDGEEQFVTADEWVVHRRFSEFVKLRTQLLALDKTFESLEFPSKRVSVFAGAAQVNTERRLALERWLTAVLAQPISNTLVSQFAAPDLEAPAQDNAVAAPPAAKSVAKLSSEPASPCGTEGTATQRTWRVRKVKIAATVLADEDGQALVGGKEDTAYTLQVHLREMDSEPWEVSRKYSEFCTLRAALRKSCGTVLRSNDRIFPVDRVWTRKQMDTKAAENRLTALQTWMDNIVGLRPDESALMDFVSPEATEDDENGPSRNAGMEQLAVDAGEASAAWGASLTSLLASPALAIMRGAASGLPDGGTEGAAAQATPAGRELPLPLDAVWVDGVKFLTPSILHTSDTPVQYQPPAEVANLYAAEQDGLLPPPSVDLYRVTHEHRSGLGFQPVVVKHARITGISTKCNQGKDFTVYTLYCEPREGFGWIVSKRFSDFVSLRAKLGAVDEGVLALEFPAKWFPGMMLGSEETQRAAAMTRKTVLAAWLTQVIALCMEKEPLLLFFHGCSDTDDSQQTDDALRDSGTDALKDLVLVSHVTIRVAPAPTGGFWKGERHFVVWVFPEFGGDGWRILRTMSEFVAVRTKLIAELEQVESVEFPVVSAWSAFGSKETDGLLSGRASLLQAWVEGTLALASRHPLLLKFLQDDGTFTEQTEIAAAAAPTSARVSPEKESVGEQFIAEYQCLRRCQIRADAAMDSEKVGVLDMGATVVVFEEKKLESGVHRVRFDQGWCSLATADGTTVLARRSSSSTPTVGKGDSESGPLTNPDSNDTSSAVNNEEAKHVATGEEQPATTGGWLGSLLPSSPWRSSTTVARADEEAAKGQERAAQELLSAAGPGKGEWV